MTIAPAFELLAGRTEVEPFIPLVVAAADAERTSFGFLPARAYGEFALQGRLILARHKATGGLAGYIAFGGTAPQARIFQTYVAPAHRRMGLACSLVEEVIRRSEAEAFLSIRVEIASDLTAADEFYKSCGFRRVRERTGGKTTRRTIVTRVRELRSPSLLDLAGYGTPGGPAINLTLATASKPGLYLIDLNVLFDVTKRRNRAVGAGRVFAAALDNAASLAVSSELIAELERTTEAGAPDPILELARNLPRLKPPPASLLAVMKQDLAPVVFPSRATAGKLSKQDQSDLAHLATAIDQNADGFITSEKAILRCSEWFRINHGLDVLSPEVFGKRFTSATRASAGYRVRLGGQIVTAGQVSPEQTAAIRKFIEDQDAPQIVMKAALFRGSSVTPRRLIAVQEQDELVAFGSWVPATARNRVARLYLFGNETSAILDAALDHIVETADRDVAEYEPAVLEVTLPSDQVLMRSRLLEIGFRPPEHTSTRAGKLSKLCLGTIVSEANWTLVRGQLIDLAGIELPVEPPVFHGHHDQITLKTVSGQTALALLSELEDFVGPSIFALDGRPAAIVPIRPAYAEALFRGSTQPSFLNDEQAALLRRRRYLSASTTYVQIPENGLIFFYESSYKGAGRASSIAVARVVRRYLAPEDVAVGLASERGVLSVSEIEGMARGKNLCVTEFDNLMMFRSPVRLSRLKVLGCADAANMVTARKLDATAVCRLLSEGMPTCAQ